MNADIRNKIKNILLIEDIEGLIELGTPVDEYNDEAEKIYNAINDDGSENILEKIYFIWSESFSLDTKKLEERKAALRKVADLIKAV